MKGHNVWALFLRPEFEKKGIGKQLHDIILDWYFEQTKNNIWLVPAALNKGRITRGYFPARQGARKKHSRSYVTDEQRGLAGKEAAVFPHYLVPQALGTSPKTRAETFYRKAGWTEIGIHGKGEIKFEMTYNDWMGT